MTIFSNRKTILRKDNSEDGFNRIQRVIDDGVQVSPIPGILDGFQDQGRHTPVTTPVKKVVPVSAGDFGTIPCPAVQRNIACGVLHKEVVDEESVLKGIVINGAAIGFSRLYIVLQAVTVLIGNFIHC